MSIFAKLDGITTQGRVADQGHAGGEWIAIDYWNWGTRRKITSASSTRFDRESTTVQITDLWIGRRMDSATQSIVLAACCGTGVTATLRLTKTGTGSGADVFAEYVFRNSLISQYKTRKSRRLHVIRSGRRRHDLLFISNILMWMLFSARGYLKKRKGGK
ncbi:MAG: type VI secretion system tube protein Hcp [Gammaproteobacteria bacterium]|nr:type VI secretion system tube protein Hcp [Gammaproteobacteria bacterium]